MTKVDQIIKDIFSGNIDTNLKPSQFVDFYWTRYQEKHPSNNSINGSIFEQILVLSLLRAGITPVYTQTKLAFVPNVILDIVLYNRRYPVTISAKTSLRERWKQADLEAMATKYIHRDARCYVVSLSESEVNARRHESNSYMGIDKFILANKEEYDDLVKDLSNMVFSHSESIKIIETDHQYFTEDLVSERYGIHFS